MTHAYILTKLSFDANGNVVSKNVGVTFSIHEAEEHKSGGIENDFETFKMDADWQEAAATNAWVLEMRAMREIVQAQIEEALR